LRGRGSLRQILRQRGRFEQERPVFVLVLIDHADRLFAGTALAAALRSIVAIKAIG
jgi:hypothetical protein